MTSGRTIRIGLLGCGTVGTSFVQLIDQQRDAIATRTGLELSVDAISVRDTSRAREGVDPALLTTDSASIVDNPDIDVIVETIGGIAGTKELVEAALSSGKPVITANKELLAHHGPELFAAASAAGVDLSFEASVAAGIPFIRPLRESLVGENITRVMGILNGTTNYILSQMTEHGAGYADALGEAQRLGFAEADPTADVEGFDAGSKAYATASTPSSSRVTGSISSCSTAGAPVVIRRQR